MSFRSWVKSLFNYFVKKARIFLKRALTEAKEEIIGQIEGYATILVRNLKKKVNLNSDEKRNEAIKKIKEYADKHNIPATTNIIRAVIELAYMPIKDDK